MNKAVLCIGSNKACGAAFILAAVARMGRFASVTARSGIYVVSRPYSNLVAAVKTDLDLDDLVAATKAVEAGLGRTPQARKRGDVPVDIDVVMYNGRVIRPGDYSQEYFRRGLHALLQAGYAAD